MTQESGSSGGKESILFLRLVYMFHSAAMQGLGKMPDPFSGKVIRDLDGAAASIDTLDMLSSKTRGNLTPEEDRLLKHLISELKLNYIDELKRPDNSPSSDEAPPESETTDRAPNNA